MEPSFRNTFGGIKRTFAILVYRPDSKSPLLARLQQYKRRIPFSQDAPETGQAEMPASM
jgi:hypothetical protein